MLWFSPDPRYVLPIDAVHVSRTLARTIRRDQYEIRFDSDFERVIEKCSEVARRDYDCTGATADLQRTRTRPRRIGSGSGPGFGRQLDAVCVAD